jgi:hypothetical protein
MMTDCGLPGITRIPYGVHMCTFYRTREELAAALVPYFVAGLRANERCIWITAEPLLAHDALAALHDAGFDAAPYLERGALVVRNFSDWYAQAGRLKGTDVVRLWLEEEARALAAGYAGLRITGNVTFLEGGEDWRLFMDYEQLVNRSFVGRRIVTLCTYQHGQQRGGCAAAEVYDVMRRHNCTLDRPDQGWTILT